MSPNPLPCLVCGRTLEHSWAKNDEPRPLTNQPMEGTAFSTRGHYGSMFDEGEPGGKTLEIAICDDCLSSNWERTRETIDSTKPAFIVARGPAATEAAEA